MNAEPTVTVSQAGRLLGLSRDGVLRAAKAGKLGPVPKPGKWTRIPISALEAYIGRKIAPSELIKRPSLTEQLREAEEACSRLRANIVEIVVEAVEERDKDWVRYLPKRKGFERSPPPIPAWVIGSSVVDRHLVRPKKENS